MGDRPKCNYKSLRRALEKIWTTLDLAMTLFAKPKSQSVKGRIKMPKFTKIKKNNSMWKILSRDWEGKPQTGRKLQKALSDKELLTKVYKEPLKLHYKKTNNLISKAGQRQLPHQERYTFGK